MDLDSQAHKAFIILLEELKKMDIGGSGLFEQVAMIKNYQKILADRNDELVQLALDEMELANEVKREMPFGKFTVAERKSYVYTDAVTLIENDLKDVKKEEQDNGKAQVNITKYLLVK